MHLIDMTNARANIAYTGETPWHGLGSKLTEGAPLEMWAQEAGMQHTIERSRIVYRWGEERGQTGIFEGNDVLWRSDTKQALATVELLVDITGKRDSNGDLTNEKQVKRVVSDIMTSLARAPGASLETAHGSAWGVMNAVTHYVDFKARARNQNNRFTSGQFGAGAQLKKDVFNALIAA